MVHALERARDHLPGGGKVVLLQPHQVKRPSIAMVSSRGRQPVADLVNSVFQPLIDRANASIQDVVDRGLFTRVGGSHHYFRVRLEGQAELWRYLHLTQRPPRFPPGGRRRLHDLWHRRTAGAQIEVTEYLSIFALRRTQAPDTR